MDITIRPYTPADLDALVQLWLESWRSTGVPVVTEVTSEFLRGRMVSGIAGGWIVYVATNETGLVGFLAYFENELEQLFLSPAAQNKGVGKRLLDFVKSQMPNGFWLTTALESGAGRFYEREGLARGDISSHPRFGHKIIRYDWKP